jgi:N-dimethylarginine dimethylaminohydrolase
MCAPTLYDVTYVINPWMEGNLHAASRDRAHHQWQRLHDVLAEVAEVLLVTPEPGSPDMVFTANAGLERDGSVVLSSFFHPERQAEEQHFQRWFEQAGYAVTELHRTEAFEGEGDALFSIDGSRLWVGFGPRTLLASHTALARVWPVEVVSLRLIDPRFYHLDTCFAPLEDGSVLYYPGAFDQPSLAQIEAFYPHEVRIPVAEADAACFACNAVNVGNRILMNRMSPALSTILSDRGFEVTQLDLSEFLKAGGAAKCLVMKLSRPRPKS